MYKDIVVQKIKNAAIYVYILVYSLLLSAFALSNPLHSAFIGDSAVFVYVARVILDGGMPYRDTFDHKGPLIYLIDAFGLLINERVGIWLLEVLTLYLTFLFAYKIARLLRCDQFTSYLGVIISVFVLLCYFQGGNLTEEYACAFITVALYCFLKFFITGSITIHNWFVCGVCFVSVCLLRANMIALWIVMCIGLLVVWIKNKKKFDVLRFVSWFMAGALFVLLPIFIWIFKNDAFSAFIDNYIVFNMLYSSDQQTVSFYNVWGTIKFFVLNPVILASILLLLCFCVKQNKLVDWLCLNALLLSIIMSSISGRKHVHYGMIFYPFVIYAFLRLLSSLIRNRTAVKSAFIRSIKIVITLLSVIGYYHIFVPYNLFVSKIMGTERQVAKIIQSMTTKTDKITVCGNDDAVYLLSNRKSASKYSYQFPIANINYEIWQEYFNDIKKLTAKVIVILPGDYEVFPYMQIKSIIKDYYVLAGKVGETEIFMLK